MVRAPHTRMPMKQLMKQAYDTSLVRGGATAVGLKAVPRSRVPAVLRNDERFDHFYSFKAGPYVAFAGVDELRGTQHRAKSDIKFALSNKSGELVVSGVRKQQEGDGVTAAPDEIIWK